jgi:NADPH-dependent 7-cyano-7-deazaguanine reductase QueF
MTGQPDFAHLVIDHVPGDWLVESKSPNLYPGAFRNHAAGWPLDRFFPLWHQ